MMSDPEKKPSVLVVDDHRINRLMLKMPLIKAEYDVTLSSGGVDALKLLKLDDNSKTQPQFDIIILDIMMPDLSGIEVLKKIREVYPPEALPVIMATALKASKDMTEALDLGANDYLTKPIDIPVLIARVQVHLKLRQTHLKSQH